MPLYVSLELDFSQFLLAAKTIKLLYGHILESCQSIYSVLTDHRGDNVQKTRFCLIYNLQFNFSNAGIPREFD